MLTVTVFWNAPFPLDPESNEYMCTKLPANTTVLALTCQRLDRKMPHVIPSFSDTIISLRDTCYFARIVIAQGSF